MLTQEVPITKTDDDLGPDAFGRTPAYWRGVGLGEELARHPISRVLLRPFVWLVRSIVRRRNKRLFTAFRKAHPDEKSLACFVFSESHQFDYFFGREGCLREYHSFTVLRDWRRDMKPAALSVDAWTAFNKTFEGMTMRRYRLSNLAKHLPFLLIFGPEHTVLTCRLSRLYRGRMRDKREDLAKVVDELKEIYGTVRHWYNRSSITTD